ncbi:sensor histidine kinase [Flavobacterium haoranii]|uniref:histidine kinase n=1 Tax=Flavobacterium haoranii TaxID=683124 RepID=A0A1M6FHC8_9FLAO|nr:sensor histidine kinase [Flavobacterium haoranii]SHI97085.1 Histidine kinase [Flavobacterium haoranii]
MKVFLKTFLIIFYVILFLNTTYVFSSNNKFLETFHSKDDSFFQENKQPISKQTINEIKKSQILLVIIITFFVFGFLFLIYHLKKVSIINKQLKNYAQENEFLISETNHRVNNNLQLISLLISDAVKKKQSEEHKNDFLKLLSKVDTIALLHRHLYQTKNKTSINLKKYLEEIKTNFDEISEEKKITIDFEISFVEINSDTAMYIGLLVTELIINSVKHAFEENQEKNISLTIDSKEDILNFKYCDNGKKAIGKFIEPKLIHQLCLQLDAVHQITTTQGFCLIFEKKLI